MISNDSPATPPYIPKDKLIGLANNFLNKHNPKGTIPVLIEEIVELSLGIKVVPVPNLKRGFPFDSFITSDFKHIIIDGYTYDNFEDRTRFTYAHELGHFILHKDFYESQSFNDVQQYLKYQNDQSDELLKRVESQAYLIAGYLLLPQNEFRAEVDKLIEEAGGIDKLNPLHVQQIMDVISEKFFVSQACAQKQFISEYEEVFEALKKSV